MGISKQRYLTVLSMKVISRKACLTVIVYWSGGMVVDTKACLKTVKKYKNPSRSEKIVFNVLLKVSARLPPFSYYLPGHKKRLVPVFHVKGLLKSSCI